MFLEGSHGRRIEGVLNVSRRLEFSCLLPFYFENSDDWMASDENYLASAR